MLHGQALSVSVLASGTSHGAFHGWQCAIQAMKAVTRKFCISCESPGCIHH